MAVIKFKRGSGVPTGLTAYEAAWDTSFGRFFINNGSTATWIGARIDPTTTLGGAGACAYFVPTQLAVKTYVDAQVAGGAVSSVNGATGAVLILGGTGIAVSTSLTNKGITIGVNSNVALLDTAQTFTGLKSFSAGISASGGFTLFGSLLTTSTIRAGATLSVDAVISGFQYKTQIGTSSINFIFDEGGDNDRITLRSPASYLGGQQYVIDLPLDNGTLALSKNTVSSVNGSTGAVVSVSSLNSATGAVSLFAGTGLSVATSVSSRGITFTNTGVTGLTGTVNQIAVSGTTGSITLSLPSAITVPGSLTTTSTLSVGTDLTVTGNLTVNGTTTTVNSNTVTIQDPVIAIGGAGTTNAPPPSGDVKDRGIVFQYNSSGGKTGFFGHDQSTGYFTYIPNISSLSSDVVTGTAGTAQLNEVRGLSGVTFTITAPATTSSIIEMRGGAAYTNTLISLEASTVEIGNYGSRSGIKFTETGRGHLLAPASSMSASRTYDLPDHSGTVVVPTNLGDVGYILASQGSTSQPVWIKPDDAGTGITAAVAKLVTVSSSTDSTSFLTFIDTASASNQAIRYNSNLAYNASTNYLDVNIDCGAY